MVKPIMLHNHAGGPNPVKIAILLEELKIPYTSVWEDIATLHTPVYEKVNPNGRLPAIEDPNTGITIWESGAIMQYLVETYDPSGALHPLTAPDRWHAVQYLHFQTSGQGPYFGQYAWFSHFHPEKIPSAITRYRNEIKRVTKVLDGILDGKEGLVGGKVSYADLAFVPWYMGAERIEEGALMKELKAENPSFKKWIEGLAARESVVKVYKERAEKMAADAAAAEAKK